MTSKKQPKEPVKYKIDPDDSPLYGLLNEPMASYVKEATIILTHGVADNAKGLNVIDKMRKGVPFEEFEELFGKLNISNAMWSSLLGINPRTFDRIRKERKIFSFHQSSQLLEIYALMKYGIEVLGSEDKFKHWLNTPKRAFRDKKPIEYLDSTLGIGYIYSELGRIEHGIFA